MFIKTDDQNNIATYPYSIDQYRAENKNKSLPKFLNNRYLATEYVFPVYASDRPEYNEPTQAIRADIENPYLDEDSEWKYYWVIVEKTEEQIARDTEAKATEVRTQRDTLLSECDWVTLRAADTNTLLDLTWATYRQALRDVTAQDGFPYTIEWPEKP